MLRSTFFPMRDAYHCVAVKREPHDKNNKNITDLYNIKLYDRVSQSECLYSEKPAVKNRLGT